MRSQTIDTLTRIAAASLAVGFVFALDAEFPLPAASMLAAGAGFAASELVRERSDRR